MEARIIGLEHEIKAILDAYKFSQLRNMLTVGFFTGVGLEELIVLKWTDINFDDGILHVQRAFCCGQNKETKTKAGNRLIDLTSQAIIALKRQLKIQELKPPLPFITLVHISDGTVSIQPCAVIGQRP